MIILIGFLAGILTAISVLPQLIKSLKTKKVKDVSLGMFVVYDIGLFLWILYGYFIGSVPIMIMNGIAFLISLTMTLVKIKFD